MKECCTCKHGDKEMDESPCKECEVFDNWEPENPTRLRARVFLEKCDEVDSAIHTGDILLHMNLTERVEFMAFLTEWLKKFAESEREG